MQAASGGRSAQAESVPADAAAGSVLAPAAAAAQPWDGHLPWPRYPSWLAQSLVPRLRCCSAQPCAAAGPAASDDAQQPCFTLSAHVARCDAVVLEQWPAMRELGEAVAAAMAHAAVHTPMQPPLAGAHAAGDSPAAAGSEGHTDHAVQTVQPWALPGGAAAAAAAAAAQRAPHAPHLGTCTSAVPHQAPHTPAPHGGISLSGRLRGRVGPLQASNSPLPPLAVWTAGPPLCRFLCAEPGKLAAADQSGSGGGMYQVRQPETRSISLTPGTLQELGTCMASWVATRVLARLPLATLTSSGGGWGGAARWHVSPDATACALLQQRWHTCGRACSGQPGDGGAAALQQRCLGCSLEHLACWLRVQLGADPVTQLLAMTAPPVGGDVSSMGQVPLASEPRPPPAWGAAELGVRWWSNGAMEPLRAAPAHDRLLVQAHGSCRVLLVPPSCALRGLAPFPAAHPYAGYSAPGVATTARPLAPALRPKPLGTADEAGAEAGAGRAMAAADHTARVAATHCDGSATGGPSTEYGEQEAALCGAAAQLWPAFAGVRGQAAVLQPGDAVYVPAGWALHLESLHPPAAPPPPPPPSAAAAPDSGVDARSTPPPPPPLPGNVMMEVGLRAAGVGSAPRDLGALQLQAAALIEAWAAQVTGSEGRVRQLCLDLADRLEKAGTTAAEVATAGAAHPTATPPAVRTAAQAGSGSGGTAGNECSFSPAWVSFGAGARRVGPQDASGLAGNFRPRHWVRLPDSAGGQGRGAAAGGCWQPCWDTATLAGYDMCAFGRRVLEVLAPITAAEAVQPHAAAPSGGGGGDSGDHCQWEAGGRAASFLRGMCAGRLLPTSWLNKLPHNDAIVLKDVPYRYAIEYANDEEAEFPELFQPQLQRREAVARAAARDAHLQALRLTGSARPHAPLLSAV